MDARSDNRRLALEFAFGKSTENPVKIRGQIKPAARKLFLDQCLVCENIVGTDGRVSGIQSVAHADIARNPRFRIGSCPGNLLLGGYPSLQQLGDPRHDWLCNYKDHVQAFDLDAPPGFADIGAFNAALAASLREKLDAGDHPLDQSLRWGAQTSYNLKFSDDPVIRAYFTALEAPVTAYINSLGSDGAHPLISRKTGQFTFSGGWSVLLRPGGFHVNHTHPEGWISSSYYVSLPKSMGGASGQEGWIKFGEARWPVPGCGIERVVEPREGRLVLFPSFMWHGTIPFSSGERMTAPFDVVPI